MNIQYYCEKYKALIHKQALDHLYVKDLEK